MRPHSAIVFRYGQSTYFGHLSLDGLFFLSFLVVAVLLLVLIIQGLSSDFKIRERVLSDYDITDINRKHTSLELKYLYIYYIDGGFQRLSEHLRKRLGNLPNQHYFEIFELFEILWNPCIARYRANTGDASRGSIPFICTFCSLILNCLHPASDTDILS